MDRNIKMIWEFHGPKAFKTAKHHESHLKDYIKHKKLNLKITGIEKHSDNFVSAFMVTKEHEMQKVRNDLNPHRGKVYVY